MKKTVKHLSLFADLQQLNINEFRFRFLGRQIATNGAEFFTIESEFEDYNYSNEVDYYNDIEILLYLKYFPDSSITVKVIK